MVKRKVFGIGLNKTGTKTLGQCLETFGFNHVSWDRKLAFALVEGRMDYIWQTADRYDSGEDWPWPMLWRELAERYPDARFILTTRKSPETWLKSLIHHARRLKPEDRIDEHFYGCRYPENDPERIMEIYRRHNQEVSETLGDRCLRVCWETGSGWKKLCDFLGEPVPHKPFPHANPAPRLNRRARVSHWVGSKVEARRLRSADARSGHTPRLPTS